MSKLIKCFLFAFCLGISAFCCLAVQGAPSDPAHKINWNIRRNFPDCDKSFWAYEDVAVLAANGFLKGDEKGLVNPDDQITRAEAAKILYEYKNGFPHAFIGLYADVESTDWYAACTEFADRLLPERYNESGNRIFSPNEYLSRADAVYAVLQIIDAADELFAAPLYVLDNFYDKSDIPLGLESHMGCRC